MVWAFATLSHACPKLLDEVEMNSACLSANGSAQNIANTIWAFATLGHACPTLLDEIEKRSAWLAAIQTRL